MLCFLQESFPQARVLLVAPRWQAQPWYAPLVALASFQCVLPPWPRVFEKVVRRHAGPSFAPAWEFKLFAINCSPSPGLSASLHRAMALLSQLASSLQPVASVLQTTLTDRLIKTEEIPPQQVERLCTVALAA